MRRRDRLPGRGIYGILQNRIRGAAQMAYQVATLRDDSLAGHQGRGQLLQILHTRRMISFTAIEQRHDYASIQ